MTAREEILGRIRTALSTRDSEPITREYATALSDVDVVALFAERVADYQATVRRVTEAELPAAIAEALPDGRIAVPEDLPPGWLPSTVDTASGDLTTDELDACTGVLTGCALAIAETGTIVLDHGVAQGRRALTLVPDLYVCVVRADQIVGTVPEATAACDHTRPLTWISGPSATSDIELNRVEGVHGPRTLIVLVVESA